MMMIMAIIIVIIIIIVIMMAVVTAVIDKIMPKTREMIAFGRGIEVWSSTLTTFLSLFFFGFFFVFFFFLIDLLNKNKYTTVYNYTTTVYATVYLFLSKNISKKFIISKNKYTTVYNYIHNYIHNCIFIFVTNPRNYKHNHKFCRKGQPGGI